MGQHTEARLRRIQQIQTLQRVLDQRLKQWITELDSNQRAGEGTVNQICRSLARELSRLRIRAGEAELEAFADLAGSLSVAVLRARPVDSKVHRLREGLADLHALLAQALDATMSADFKRPKKSAS